MPPGFGTTSVILAAWFRRSVRCGVHFRRMDQFLGRSDNMVKLRGVNIYPMACLPAVRSDPRTTGEWLREAHTVESGGSPRDAMIVHIEVRKDAGSVAGLQEKLEARLKSDLGVSVDVRLVDQGELDTVANLGEGKVSDYWTVDRPIQRNFDNRERNG